MAIKALSLSTTIEYQSDLDPDKGKEGATTWKLGAIPQRAYAIIKDKGSNFKQDQNDPDDIVIDFKANDIAYDIVRLGLKGFTNYTDDKGKETKFKTQGARYGASLLDAVHTDIMDTLPLDVTRELCLEIRKLNELSKEDEKNSKG